jgi:GINS complex subunit 1
MHCETATRLIRDIKRSTGIPPPEHQSLRVIAHEIQQLNDWLTDSADNSEKISPEALPSMLLHYNAVIFNKRCALAYLNERMNRLQELWWATGSVQAIPSEVHESLFECEKQFLQKYDELIGEYMRSEDIDLHMDMAPPQQLFVECKVLKNAGKVMTDSGVFNLEENTSVLMKRKDAELLIRQGILQHIE